MPDTRPPADFEGSSLSALAAQLEASGGAPPVERWNPAHCGDSEMVIRADGSWLHQGRPITRPAMVRLFSTVLRREADGSHVLVTPVEKLSIAVERTPFRAVAMKSEGEGKARRLAFRLDTGDSVIAGPDHPIRIEETPEGPSPRLHVRGPLDHGLEAELDRPVYYELAEIALAEDADPPGIWSDGAFFALG
ncbi:DUF1285 domain-containing protein [Sphingomicrobium aestuariivivum]|uniref:DUF1285 domain-containing protein n=1 Tax=Sphingomicrobium aestuariivivum TaxID=1582356 RepID=UPI001FD6B050|nr:DUF1285 domain-containing protein [Sphingomicrobium aestuariivivum]MCJ8191846.1 DUF1285 domain-containing protein [Sphingomicrobium aestuariivivum]